MSNCGQRMFNVMETFTKGSKYMIYCTVISMTYGDVVLLTSIRVMVNWL
jgi:hypothetical protein